MSKIHRSDLLGRTFRASPSYELVLFDRLTLRERQTLEHLRDDPGFYGVLRPREVGSRQGVKSVDRETALLFLTLREPGPLPSYLETALGEEIGRTIARLVADGILEVEEEGAFLSGPAVFVGTGGEAGQGRLAELSLAALRYGQELDLDDPRLLSLRLYGYNRRPLTPRWKRLLASAEAVQAHLGLASGGASRRLLDGIWTPLRASEAWLSWRIRSGDPSSRPDGATFKLYVSPVLEALGESFGEILAALAVTRAPCFKIGADAAGLLRPDKIVAWFPDFERLVGAAHAIASRLEGVAAQGVPFTSEIAGEGLLSWGADPPAGAGAWGTSESWRLWLTHRLARALLDGRAAEGAEIEPWRFALERVRLEGVDPETWTPGALLRREI
ncbi:MAG TPA: hypothetical protein VE685_22250 [Thermoanaerobaculia bacterium]|nr:hypothetical protein [Thermoanaerobaculia bacterium]